MIYFDNAATTKPFMSSILLAEKFNKQLFYNPSTLYSEGLACAREIKSAKECILKNLGAKDCDVIFTSCGTESNNLAIFCCVKRGTYLTDLGEHSAVQKCFLELKQRGNTVDFVSINADGTVNQAELYKKVVELKVDFVSIMHVNNETGAINDVNKIAKTIKNINKKIIFHVDGVQAFSKIPFKLAPEIDLYSISAHKINALKGVGALIKRKSVNLSPLLFGGGQEGGIRSGTENVFGIKVFEYSMIEHFKSLKNNFEQALQIKNLISEKLDKENFKIISGENSSPYILTVSALGLRGEVVMHSLESKGLLVGNGSACSSKNRFSRVIEACGYPANVLDGVIRLSFSAENTIEEAESAVNLINQTVKELRRKLL